jgi:hypothetical protein
MDPGEEPGRLIPILIERDSSRSIPRNGAGAHSRFDHKTMIGSDHRVLVLSQTEKAAITAACQRLIDEVLKPRFLPVIRPTEFNYPVDICGKWHGTRYRFIQRYRSGFPKNLGEEFDAPFTRLDWISPGRFDLQWHRHTGEWFCLDRGLSLTEALNTIIADGLLHLL